MSSSLMAPPDWQMSILSNAAHAVASTEKASAMGLIFQALFVPFCIPRFAPSLISRAPFLRLSHLSFLRDSLGANLDDASPPRALPRPPLLREQKERKKICDRREINAVAR